MERNSFHQFRNIIFLFQKAKHEIILTSTLCAPPQKGATASPAVKNARSSDSSNPVAKIGQAIGGGLKGLGEHDNWEEIATGSYGISFFC